MLPCKLKMKYPRVGLFIDETKLLPREDNLNVLEEKRDLALIHISKYLHNLHRYYECHVKQQRLEVHDLVLRWVQTTVNYHRLSPTWEGPFKVITVKRSGAYKLGKDGFELDNT